MIKRLGYAVLFLCLHASVLRADPFEQGLQAQEAGKFSAAIVAYREAAEAGETPAMVNLGNLLRAGLGTQVDHVQAAHWYRLAATAGNPLGQVNLANLYLSGWGVEASTTEAVRWFRRAARQGDATAQHNLGLLLSQPGHALYNPSEAMFWFELAFRGGIQTSEYASALLASSLTREQVHETRIRVDRFQATPETPREEAFITSSQALRMFGDGAVTAALAAFEQAASRGETGAQFELAQMHEHGIGVPQDPALAQYWLRMAAQNGHRLASTQLLSNGDYFPAVNTETRSPETDTLQTSVEARIESLLREWSEAWSERDFARYIGFYSDRFVPAGGLSDAAWRAQRRSRLRTPEWIAIELADPAIEQLSDNRWRVRFTQNYRSNRYQSETTKELVLGLEDGALRIERERVLP